MRDFSKQPHCESTNQFYALSQNNVSGYNKNSNGRERYGNYDETSRVERRLFAQDILQAGILELGPYEVFKVLCFLVFFNIVQR